MARILRKLRIRKVDLCREGANPEADILLFKSMDGPDDAGGDHSLLAKRNIPASHRHDMPRSNFAGPHESFPIEEPGDVKNAWDLAGHAQNPDAVRARIKRIAHRKGAAFVAALPETAVKKEKPVAVKKVDLTKAKPEEVAQYALDLEKFIADQEEALEKAAKKPASNDDEEEPDADDVKKNMDCGPMAKSKKKTDNVESTEVPVLKAKVASQDAEIQKANKKAEDAEALAKSLQNQLELAEIVKSVEKDLPSLPGTTTEVAKMLQEAKATLTKDSYTVLEKALKAGSAAIDKASKEIGSSNGTPVGTAEQEIFKQADELVAKGTVKTRPEGVVQICKSNPDLAERYRIEKDVKSRR